MLQLRRTGGAKIAIDHSLTVNVQNAAFGKAAPDRPTKRFARTATRLDEQHRLGHGADRYCDDLLVSELRKKAPTARSNMRNPAKR